MKTKALVLAVVVAAGILGIRVRESNGGVVSLMPHRCQR